MISSIMHKILFWTAAKVAPVKLLRYKLEKAFQIKDGAKRYKTVLNIIRKHTNNVEVEEYDANYPKIAIKFPASKVEYFAVCIRGDSYVLLSDSPLDMVLGNPSLDKEIKTRLVGL